MVDLYNFLSMTDLIKPKMLYWIFLVKTTYQLIWKIEYSGHPVTLLKYKRKQENKLKYQFQEQITETYLKPNQTSKMGLSSQMIKGWKPLIILEKSSILDFYWALNAPPNYKRS